MESEMMRNSCQSSRKKQQKRVRLTVAYDGTNYHGWQIQNNGITIESELNRCLTDLLTRAC